MIKTTPSCLVILAGGQSTRMGSDKAIVHFEGQRLIDRLIDRYAGVADRILLSGRHDYGTGLAVINDKPDAPDGPVGAILSIAATLPDLQSDCSGFVTLPVDAPHAPADLIKRLSANGACTVAQDQERIHPTFAYWRCDVVNAVGTISQPGERAPSLHWLTRQCEATPVTWPDSRPFINVNRPEDLATAAKIKKAGA